MALTSTKQPAAPQNLTTSRGAALYIGALLGPGLLLLPGLAAAEAGPASILAWLALLGLSGLFAAVFSALGRHIQSADGVIGYVTAGLGPRAGMATGWMFLAGVVCGAPIVCLIGASYVTDLTGGGQLARAAVAAALLLAVIGLAAGGLRVGAAAQLVLVSLLTGVVVVAVAGSAAAARASNWAPFTPHGWLSVGSAAATLMFSFAGWEAVAPLTTRFADPGRQLPRAVAIALAVTTALYLGLAVATISVLGPRAATDVPLAGLLSHAVGTAGPDAAAGAAIVLTMGATNAYISGAAAMAGQLAHAVPGSRRPAPMLRLLAAITAAGLLLITGYGLRIVGTAALVAVPTALFLAVYLAAMAAAARVLCGAARLAAPPAALAAAVMLGFCGWALAIPAAVVLATTTGTIAINRLKTQRLSSPTLPGEERRPCTFRPRTGSSGPMRPSQAARSSGPGVRPGLAGSGRFGEPGVQPFPDFGRGVGAAAALVTDDHHPGGGHACEGGQSQYFAPAHLLRLDRVRREHHPG
jgi:amino acid efflux transporter